MHVELPDGKRLELPDGSTGAAVAQAIGPGLAKAALGTRVNGHLSDLQTTVPDGASIAIVTKRDADAITLHRAGDRQRLLLRLRPASDAHS